jgi:hypothetical protein
MLVPHVVAWSMMLGAVLSWGVMWPLLMVREACAFICLLMVVWGFACWCRMLLPGA